MATPLKRPSSVPEYLEWLASRGTPADDRQRTLYETIVTIGAQQFTESEFWGDLIRLLPEWDDKFKLDKGVPLLETADPEVVTKSYNSFVQKTFRLNVLENRAWSRPPAGGWIAPPDWVFGVNDVIRTLVTAKYLDAVRVLAESIEQLAGKHGISSRTSMEATSQGYYAAHLTLRPSFRVPTMSFEATTRSMAVEIQITTQLQESIRGLLHKEYEVRRISGTPIEWEWNYRSSEFATNYLGHVLHYIEGKIVEVRDREDVTSD